MIARRAVAAVAGLAACLIALSGCEGWTLPGLAGEPSGVPSTPALDPGLRGEARYYAQRVDWTACGNGMRCAEVVAPLDWSQPDAGEDIRLAVTMHPATGNRLGALFTNPGGPGASGYDFVHDYWDSIFTPELAASYDLIGWDPRGVGRSAPVRCYTAPEDVEDWLYGIVPEDPRSDAAAWIAAVDAAGRDYVDACVANSGPVLGHVDTVSTVHDLDLLRAVVGDSTLHYIGFSYGTKIGQQYIEDFPEQVGRIVLDGVTDPSLDLFHVVLEQQAGFERALTNYLTSCPALFGGGCPFTAGVKSAQARIHALVAGLDARPLPATAAGDRRELDGQTLTTAIAQALYSQRLWPDLNGMFEELFRGSPSTDTAFALADAYNDFTPGLGYRTNLQDAFTAIDCLDYATETDLTTIAEQDDELAAAAPTLSDWTPPMRDPVCGQWPFPSRAAAPHPITGEGVSAPILVVSTTGDPATPYEWGVRVAAQLRTGVLVTHRGEGHTAYSASAGSCIRSAVDDYLVHGTVPASDPMCGDD